MLRTPDQGIVNDIFDQLLNSPKQTETPNRKDYLLNSESHTRKTMVSQRAADISRD